jgi:DNA polymerase
MPTLLDFESRSRCDLKRRGGRNYWAHASTEALCCVYYDTDRDAVGVWTPGDPPPFPPGTVLGAHNARGFDRFACERLGWPGIEIDTSELARRAGLPGALDALAVRWLGLAKDKAASRFTLSLSRPSRAAARRGQLPDITPEVRERVVAYCASDVEILAHGWLALSDWVDLEADVLAADRAVNDRGVGFDSQLARRLLECDARLSERALARAAKALGMSAEECHAIASSPQQFAEFAGAENAQAETVASITAANGWPAEAVTIAEVRQAIASIARGKLTAGLERVSPDGRLRDSLRYYGAHTGRWSHKGMQLGNMPRPAKRFEDWKDAEVCTLADRVLAGKHHANQEEIELLLRACLVARPGYTLAVCDFSGVEGRGTAWCADDAKALDVFASGRDPYKVMAAQIFGRPYSEIGKDERRQVGKVAELACGYGMGAAKFGANNGPALDAAGVDASAVILAWRTLHAPTVRFWYALEAAFASAVAGTPATVDRFDFVPAEDGNAVAIFLPSGRPIVYNETRCTRDYKGRRQLSYLGTKSGREYTYGGKITENVIQAMCRDLMADALVRCEAAGLEPVLHVHDEIVCEVPRSAELEGYECLEAIMLDVPAWAEGFPIGAAGHTGIRYRK